MKNFKKIVGNNIRFYRQQQGFSQEKLAEKSSLHRTYIGSVERGERNISLENIVAIANSLSIPPYKLIRRE